MCERLSVKRRSVNGNLEITEQKKNSLKYYFKSISDDNKQLCKTFFLTTLGFKKKYDRFLFEFLNKTPHDSITPAIDMRGKNNKSNCIPKHEIQQHIESFYPVISHYQRDHAPNTRYLPSDVSKTFMHEDFSKKFLYIKVPYELYKKEIPKKNILFALLGNEECDVCECFQLEHEHHKNNLQNDCLKCFGWKKHLDTANEARDFYKRHADIYAKSDNGTICFIVDLGKKIMLPRIDTFNNVLFANRMIAYNESFVPVGKTYTKTLFAVLWHEGVSGRNKENIKSAFFAFLKHHRDANVISV